MPLPTGLKVEVEFVAGVWTDVTADYDNNAGFTFQVGRTSPSSQAQTSSVGLQLRNDKGKYTPFVQVLSDGTASTTYPNVVPRKRLRISTSSGVRWLGYIKSLVPNTNGFSGASMCVINAADVMDRLSRFSLMSPIRQEISAEPFLWAFWPLTEPSGSTTAADQSGYRNTTLSIPTALANQAALTFGDDGPGSGDGTGVRFAPTAANSGQVLATPTNLRQFPDPPSYTAATFEMWINPGVTRPSWGGTSGETFFFAQNDDNPSIGFLQLWLLSGTLHFVDGTSAGGLAGPNLSDGAWHHIVLTRSTTGANAWKLYVDNALVGSANQGVNYVTTFNLGDAVAPGLNGTPGRYQGNMGYVAVYATSLSTTRIAAHYNAGHGWVGETVDARIIRFLTVAGLTASDWSIPASTVTLGTYSQDGKDVLSAVQDAVASEGAGAVFYVKGGVATFQSRTFRKPTTPVLTVAAGSDDDAAGFVPSVDDSTLVNQVTVTRSSASGGDSTQTVGATTGEIWSQSVTTYTQTDDDALNLAQSIIAANDTPGWRLPKITVDLLTATHNFYGTLQNIDIGDRIRMTGLVAGQAPASQVDVIVEGWTETVNVGTYKVVFDTSPADNPAMFIWQDATYGDWQPLTDCALNAAITSSATTVVIKSPTGPAFTTSAGAYPLTIQVGGEQITLNSAPGGSTSPQTFTGVTRGVNGTTAAAQAINAQVLLAPTASWAL